MTKSTLFIFAIFYLSFSTISAQDVDLSNWKITIPAAENGKVISVGPPEIFDFENNEKLKPFFYKDPKDGALVFYAYPAASTPNSSYSRTELREQREPGNDDVNWTFAQGGTMRGTLSVPEVSKDSKGKYHKVIVMQIHGRLSDEQRDLIGEDDNNAPPILKIYWEKGAIKVKTKVLKDLDASDTKILHTDAWRDDEGISFDKEVGFEPFTLEIVASDGRLEVILNDDQSLVYENIHMEKWSVFENYFKAGNYFQSKDQGSYAKVKYFSLEVTHP